MRRLIALAIVLGANLSPLVPLTAAPVRSVVERRQDRVVLQHFDLSCGAAALATILTYQHGDPVSERQVALGLINRGEYLSNPQLVRLRQGFSLFDMKAFVERRGYRGEGLANLDFAGLLARAPAIVPLRIHGFRHFVVLRGAQGGNVLLADPAFGVRSMPLDAFLAAWEAYPRLGRVAFLVERRDGLFPPNQLSATPGDFPVLR
jgi:hypothetical protein